MIAKFYYEKIHERIQTSGFAMWIVKCLRYQPTNRYSQLKRCFVAPKKLND